jgi:glycosyltransferase involved in cell wall biosynthesis
MATPGFWWNQAVDEFAQAIIELLKDPAERERLGRNARRQAIEQHSWEQYIRRLEGIYLSVL